MAFSKCPPERIRLETWIPAALLLGAAALSVASCAPGAPPGFSEGTVIDKVFTPAFTTMVPVTCGNGCTTYTSIIDGPHYVLKVGWCSGDDCRVERFEVEPSTYEDLDLGDTYPRSGPDTPVTTHQP